MYLIIKRALDFFFASILMIILLPLCLFSGIGIWLSMGQPILFLQKRIGKKNEEFVIYKFRSMQKKTSKNQMDSTRITRVGRILRVSRIDELPQLINILKGDMSFVGPRPLMPEYLVHYSENELKRHEVRPGLSGLSQISTSYPTWEEQFKFDVEYVENLSFALDIKILLKTVRKVLFPSAKLISGRSGRVKFDVYRQNQLKNKSLHENE